eukprot:scaffold149751_cov55-Attheya_sp.AAC.1
MGSITVVTLLRTVGTGSGRHHAVPSHFSLPVEPYESSYESSPLPACSLTMTTRHPRPFVEVSYPGTR